MTKSNNSTASEKKNSSHQCGVGEGVHDAGKDNSTTATLRTNSVPKPEKVVEIDPEKNSGVATRQAQSQNESDGKGKAGTNQIPVGRSRPTTTSSGN